MTGFPNKGLWKLARRVAAGEVVFFIGAGFSIDSEGNTAKCLIRRLVARFLAMTEILQKAKTMTACDTARDLRKGFFKTFSLRGKPATVNPIAVQANVESLAREYYHINDWISSAFGVLLGALNELSAAERGVLLGKIHERESDLRERLEKPALHFERTGVPLQPIDLDRYEVLEPRWRGKALFLDTMGFNDEDVMAGCPVNPDPAAVARSYKDRLQPRHRVLAWLAREGLCPTLVTTNYDLLLEGAYRLAGSIPRELQRTSRNPFLPGSYEYFSRISSAEDFFSRGSGFQSALIVKIHGCTEIYRRARAGQSSSSRSGRDWQSYMPAMVFTFREIQNWREDSWSRDFLCTLLRTRTLAFAGYSGMDPVLHDTFRTVYEEMARYRAGQGSAADGAPAYFFGIADSQEFHCMEILRAASVATGTRHTALTSHPNFLPFHPSSKKGDAQPFPTLDECMLWLFHLVFRHRQWQALTTTLRRTAAQALDHPGAEADVAAIHRHFWSLWRRELVAARYWASGHEEAGHNDNDRRRRFERIVSWTSHFHTGLLRELALAEAVVPNQGKDFDIDILRRRAFYQSAGDRLDWTAWGVVLELAVRRLVASWRKSSKTWTEDSEWVRPGTAEHAQVFFARGKDAPTPSCLTIRLASFDRVGQTAGVAGVVRRHTTWHVHPEVLPWPSDSSRLFETPLPTPSAEVVWRWASGQHEKLESDEKFRDWPGHLGGEGHG